MGRPPSSKKPSALRGSTAPGAASRKDPAVSGDLCRELFELATVPYALIDRDGVIEDANLAFGKLLGQPRGRFLGDKLAKHVPPRERVGLAELLSGAFGGDEKRTGELIFRGPEGGALHARVEAVGVGAGESRRVLVAAFDTTDRVRLEADLGQGRRLQSLGRVAAEIAHDFNNVLLGVVGCADLALEHLDSESEARAHVEDVKAAGLRGVKLTSKLLESGYQEDVPIEYAELVLTVRQCEPVLRGLLGERVQLGVRVPSVPVMVGVPPIEIEQILLNLAMNARRAMRARGHLAIEVSIAGAAPRHANTIPAASKRRYASLSVSDDGAGMDPVTREHAFEPFFSGSRGGFGLGLATVRAIIERRGGHVALQSEVGRGTTIRMLLPIADDPDFVHAPPSGSAGGTVPPPSSSPSSSARPADLVGSGATVLVIEDDETSRRALTTFLDRRGYRVLSAANGVQAVRLCTGEGVRLDVIVTDLGLDGTSGDRVAAALRSLHRRAAVVYVSGRPATDSAVRRALRAPRTTFLRKPFELDELLRQIGTLLYRKQAVAKSEPEPQGG